MQSKNMFLIGTVLCSVMCILTAPVSAADIEEIVDVSVEEFDPDQISADAISSYQIDGSLFQQITDLEQEKVLMQLEKERAQLDLELDRLAAEKIKLHMEIDTLSGRAEQQQQEIETQKAKLEAEAARIEREKETFLADMESERASRASAPVRNEEPQMDIDITSKYRLVNVIGAGSQLQATVADLNTGQNKRISVGKTLDGLTVKSISLYDGVVFAGPDGTTQNLNISNGK